MKKLRFVSLPFVLAASLLADQTNPAADKTPPSYDLKPQALLDLQSLQKKFVDLAGAIPADKFGWRPDDGTRSIGEVFLHVASANFSLAANFAGAPSPGFTAKGFEKSTTDKAAIIAHVNQSFDYVRAALEKRTNKELEANVKQFGPDASQGDVVYIVVAHAHEHLGQAIAYARMNGITPPWTAEAMKKQAAQP